IGRAVGCSPFYLSRIFSKAMGMTIPQFLRQLRMERAAELLRSGKYNVTEAALEVGYSSISHFSQAFCQTIGCCPNLYPQARGLGGRTRGGATRRSSRVRTRRPPRLTGKSMKWLSLLLLSCCIGLLAGCRQASVTTNPPDPRVETPGGTTPPNM